MCQLVLPGMRERRYGRIVNLSSMGGRLTFPGAGMYHATKHAVEAISDALRFEVAGFGVKVVVVEPGLVRTEFAETAGRSMPTEEGPYAEFNADVARANREAYERGPLARLGGEPEEVAAAIERAIRRRNPPTRVRVTPSAGVLLASRRLLPDRAWDRALTTTYRSPTGS
jgi:short-subunit dehydrogenase